MTRQKQARQSQGEKGEVPKAFVRILKMRSDPLVHPYDRYSPEGLKREWEEAKAEMRMFWEKRKTPDYLKLFDGHYDWSEWCGYAGIEFGYGRDNNRRIEDYYPSYLMMELFVLLNEPFTSRNRIRDVFGRIDWDLDFKISRAQLIRILHPRVLMKLVGSFDGAQIVELFDAAAAFERNRHFSEREDFEKQGLVEKMSRSLTEKAEDRLGCHLVIDPFSIQTIRALQDEGGQISHLLANRLLVRLKEIHDNLKRTLEYFEANSPQTLKNNPL
jgi:hypothetical protein